MLFHTNYLSFYVFIVSFIVSAFTERMNLMLQQTTLCPVLYSLNQQYHNYPVDIFNSELLNILSKHPIHNATVADCFAFDKENSYPHNMTKHVCYDVKSCPVNINFIDKTLEGTKSKRNVSSLCKVAETVNKDGSKLNFIVVGGSVTLGTFAAGCKLKDSCIVHAKEDAPQLRVCVTCAWPHYLSLMVQKVFSNRDVKVLNVAKSGYSSLQMAEILLQALREQRITKLTGNDVIFVDHSTNDNVFVTPLSSKEMAVGLETLIRKIYTFSDPKSLPTIVLLATEHVPRHTIKHSSNYYTHIYSVISDHYGIPLWNMDDLYRSSYLLNANLSYTKYITRQFNWDNKHPPWMVHLFNADLIGAIILRELDECNTLSAHDRDFFIRSHYITDMSQLPPPLYNHTESEQCDTDSLLVSMSYENLVTNKGNNISRGVWESKPLNAWQLRLDVNGRSGGFIREYNHDSLNSSINVDSSDLIFTLPLTGNEFNRMQKKMLVKLTVLRSYENAGFIQAWFCGVRNPVVFNARFSGIDALWGDFESYKFSLPVTFTGLLINCPDNGDFVTLTLNHVRRTDSLKVRRNQKFKLMNIEICYANDVN